MSDTRAPRPAPGPEAAVSEAEIARLVSALGDGTRRRVYFAVTGSAEAMSKEQVASEVGIDKRLAGFHLDKLVAADFLDAEFRRHAGAGRPAKFYSPGPAEVAVQIPQRRYELLAALLLQASREGGSQEDLERVGYEFGLAAGSDAAQDPPARSGRGAAARLASLLSDFGFAASTSGDGAVTACSCPFEDLAFADPERVCGLDRAIWRGFLAATAPTAELTDATARAEGDEACRAEVVAG